MTGLLDGPVLGFDTETTGVNVHEDRIVTATLVRFAPGKRPAAMGWLVNPGIDIPEEATAVHGVTTEHARAAGTEPAIASFEISTRLARWLGQGLPVVAFNAAFDFTLLEAENRRHHNPTLADRLNGAIKPVIDPHVLDKFADPWRKGPRRLDATCQHYQVPLVAAHTSESDAASAVRLAQAILRRHSFKLRGYTLNTITEFQADWRREQMDSLRAYFDKAGIDHDGCNPGFPVHDPNHPTIQQGALL